MILPALMPIRYCYTFISGKHMLPADKIHSEKEKGLMKRRKVISAAAVAALGAVIAGGSLAYFQDQDQADNVFTVGSVDVRLNEKQRALDADGNKTTTLEDFAQNKVLMPIIGSAQGEKQDVDGHGGLPAAKNYVDKIVNVTNNGKSDAYVRAYFAIPSALDDGYETFNAAVNALHFNFGNDNNGTTFGTSWNWMHGSKWNYFETTIDGVAYNVYYGDYMQKLAPNATTTDFIQGLYLDQKINTNAAGNLTYNGNDLGWSKDTPIKCPVFTVAVQADGFDNADAAVKAAFGDKFNPWGDIASNWQ